MSDISAVETTPRQRKLWLILLSISVVTGICTGLLLFLSRDTRPTNPEFEQAFMATEYKGQAAHYRNCAPSDWRARLHERKLWKACPTDSMFVSWANRDIMKIERTPADSTNIRVVNVQNKHAGPAQLVLEFQFNGVQPFGIFMQENGGNWQFVDSPAHRIVINAADTVNFFVMATNHDATSSPKISYPQGFDPTSLIAAMEWPNGENCARSAMFAIENGGPGQMGGATTSRQNLVDYTVFGDRMNISTTYGANDAFGTWVGTQELINNQWTIVRWALVKQGAMVPTKGRYIILTLIDDPTQCNIAPTQGFDVAKLKATGQWPSS